MGQSDTRKLIVMLYVLTVLFLGAIYYQGQMINEPGAVSTLQNANFYAADSFITHFQLSGETVLITIFSMTLFFGFAWMMARSKQYSE
ncbi:MAG: hypothetical protein KDH97_14815 [Calditrichaeota bacterium]|nr:hypothetical protein [Calditrichota bacterium]MCB9089738.1 hypothetical protein [Calditrichia bacterium]MCB0291524.1 hypothetical protein [Calditrichota bacterium]MCB0293995.1 hypothetical protein [Calditrichota bacterium]MCB0305023.1 hypothetical protein [Calditrichota bacterium]